MKYVSPSLSRFASPWPRQSAGHELLSARIPNPFYQSLIFMLPYATTGGAGVMVRIGEELVVELQVGTRGLRL
jgi:hypothetical protein